MRLLRVLLTFCCRHGLHADREGTYTTRKGLRRYRVCRHCGRQHEWKY